MSADRHRIVGGDATRPAGQPEPRASSVRLEFLVLRLVVVAMSLMLAVHRAIED